MRFDWKRWGVAAVFCSLGCADFHRGPAPRDAGEGEAGLVVDKTFERDVYPILQVNCQFCHRAGHDAENSALVLTGNARLDRAMVMALVVPGDPTAGLLLQRATGEEHWGGEVLEPESADYATIADWISNLPTGP